MSLKRNILANYVSQIYVSLIGIITIPIYVKYLGAESYGLVGFFTMLLTWFYLLDLGLTPTMSREAARFSAADHTGSAVELRLLLRSFEGIFVVMGMIGAAALMVLAGVVASRWLKVEHLSLTEIQNDIFLMALIIAFRWISGLYRSVITGFERLVWLSGFNILITTARFLLVIPFFIYVGSSSTLYFEYQLLVAAAECCALIWKTYQLMPVIDAYRQVRWDWKPLKKVLKFSIPFAISTILWVAVTQIDRLLLSKFLSLTEYAYFSLASTIAGGIGTLSIPISAALLPRLTKLHAIGSEDELIGLYREATQLVGVMVIPAMLAMTFFPDEVLWAWTGNHEIVRSSALMMALYAIANAIQAFGAFAYYLQYAKGALKLHLIGALLSALLLIPSLCWAILYDGAVGAGYVRILVGLLHLILWLGFVHSRLAKGLHWKWLRKDVGEITLYTLIFATFLRFIITWPKDRNSTILLLFVVCVALLAVATISSSQMRLKIRRWIRRTES